MTILPRRGHGPVEGDVVLPGDLILASPARAMLDSIAGSGDRYLSQVEIENWLVELLRVGREHRINEVRDLARTVAAKLGREAAFKSLDRLIGATLATRPADGLKTPALRAQMAGIPYDERRIDALEELVQTLGNTAPRTLPDLPADADRRRLLPFYEAYFSNYIEGTRFTLDEAEDIVMKDRVPTDRPIDAHDIIGTYRVVADAEEIARVPTSPDELVELLKARHALILEQRPGMNPGVFKSRNNQAGATLFVAPRHVEGTLRAGFDLAADLSSPFARAVYMMFLVAEVHPFDDGNGRIARVMMNAELVHGQEVRIIIPTVYKDDYLAGLKGATNNRSLGALVDILAFAQRYTARVDFSDR
ncbi:MAG: Fic family protein, partial [Chloroflexota bacterium]